MERDVVRVECLDHVNRMVLRAAPFALPAAVLLAMIVGDAVPLGRRLAWLGVVGLGVLCAAGSALVHLRRRRRGLRPMRWVTYASAGVVALCWSSVVWVAFPPPEDEELRAIVLLFCLGVSASAAVSSAASRARFYAYQLPFAFPLLVTYWGSGDRVTRMLGIAIPLYLAATIAMHREVHGIVTSEMGLRHELRTANRRLSQLALHDGLTGLYNRTAFAEILDSAVETAHGTGEHIALLYFDVDRFKSVNDAYGHAAGDDLLAEVARRMRPVLRAGDACARLGGDEFAVVLRGLHEPAEAELVARRMLDVFAEPFRLGTQLVVAGASIGVASALEPGDRGADLLRDADTAQYRAKQAGGNRAVVFDADLRDQLERRVRDEAELRDALTAGQVVAYFQPQVDLRTGRIVGAEALVRWLHPVRGVVPAASFVETARVCGLLDRIDVEVIRQAMDAAVRLRSVAGPDGFRTWVNIGARWIAHGHGRGLMSGLLQETGCRPDELGLEITEDELLQEFTTAAELLQLARGAGMEVALDDFGTGHSSVTLLRQLPIDVLKIDRSFVADLQHDARARAIVAAICNLAGQLGPRVVAEGVETPGQLELLRGLECAGAQGYLFAPALPIDELVEMVRASRAAPTAAPVLSS